MELKTSLTKLTIPLRAITQQWIRLWAIAIALIAIDAKLHSIHCPWKKEINRNKLLD